MWVGNVMEEAMFQTHQATELSSFADVAVNLEARIEQNTETMVDSCSSRIRGDREEISLTEVKYSG